MALVERIDLRKEKSVVYQDDVDPSKRKLVSQARPIHYDNNGTMERIDMSLSRIDNAAADGWRVTTNNWHYFLGKDIANHGQEDGWVGFGGKQGQHFFKFRLAHAGYLYKPTGTPAVGSDFTHLDDSNKIPTWNRTNLISDEQSHAIGAQDTYNAQTKVEWDDLWPALPGVNHKISARWVSDGRRLKEEIVINEAARIWIAANRPPTTPVADTFFGFVFELDWSDIPRIYKQGILQGEDDHLDDGGIDPGDANEEHRGLALKNATDELLAFMPIDYVYVQWSEDTGEVDTEGNPVFEKRQEQVRLKKRFWKDTDGKHYLAVGAPVQDVNNMHAGDLVFDPTLTPSVATGADDGYVDQQPTFDTASDTNIIGGRGAPYEQYENFMRYTGITIGGSDTIDAATFEVVHYGANSPSNVLSNIYLADEDDAAAPTDKTEFDAVTLTTAFTAYDAPSEVSGTYTSPDFTSAVQEVIDRGSWASGNALVIMWLDDGTSTSGINRVMYSAYDHATDAAPQLTVDYTAGSTPASLAARPKLSRLQHLLIR